VRLTSDNRQKSSVLQRWLMLSVPLLSLATLSACGEQKIVQETVRPVKAMVIPAAATERVLTYSGVLAPRIESSLGFRVSGKILERFVNVGDRIQSGQKIARLDEKDLKLAENSARANVTAAKSRVAVAKDALARANYLLPNGFIAKSAVDQRQLEMDSAQSALDAANDQLNQAINSSSYAILVADKDGIVTSVKAEPGQVVAVGQAVITLAHSGDIEVAAAVPEQEISKLKAGDAANVALWPAQGTDLPGKIREIAGAADTASRTYSVRVTINAPRAEMRLGMTASVSFRVAQKAPPIIVPLTALAGRDGKTFAFIADKDREIATGRQVDIEGVSDAGANVKSGLHAGEILITGGVQFLQDGMKIRLPKDVLTQVADSNALPR